MSSNEDIRQELDDLLLDDLLEVHDRMGGGGDSGAKITPGQTAHKEKRETVARDEIKRISSELEISEATQNTATVLFNQYAEKTNLEGNAIEVIAAACLYAACKVESVPLSPDDFASVPDIIYTRVILLRRVKAISNTLGLNPKAFFDPTHYIDRYCEELGLEEEVSARARDIIEEADEAGIGGGKSPTGRAAAAVYNASMDLSCKVTQSEIAEVADVTEVTIRNRYQDQREIIDPIPNKFESATDASEGKLAYESASKSPVSDEDSNGIDFFGEEQVTDES